MTPDILRVSLILSFRSDSLQSDDHEIQLTAEQQKQLELIESMPYTRETETMEEMELVQAAAGMSSAGIAPGGITPGGVTPGMTPGMQNGTL